MVGTRQWMIHDCSRFVCVLIKNSLTPTRPDRSAQPQPQLDPRSGLKGRDGRKGRDLNEWHRFADSEKLNSLCHATAMRRPCDPSLHPASLRPAPHSIRLYGLMLGAEPGLKGAITAPHWPFLFIIETPIYSRVRGRAGPIESPTPCIRTCSMQHRHDQPYPGTSTCAHGAHAV